jgi:hypothetical protein
VVPAEFRGRCQLVDQRERRPPRAFDHRDSHGPIERHDRRGLQVFEHVVRRTSCGQSLSSARAASQGSAAMAASTANRPGPPAQRLLDKGERFGNLLSIPSRPS